MLTLKGPFNSLHFYFHMHLFIYLLKSSFFKFYFWRTSPREIALYINVIFDVTVALLSRICFDLYMNNMASLFLLQRQ